MVEAEYTLRDKLLRFATSERYDDELARAFDLYWGGRYCIDDAPELGETDHARFIEYYIYDYQLAEHGCTAVQLFDEFRSYTLSDEERRVLAEWELTVFGVFFPKQREETGTVLRDIFDGTELTVVNLELAMLPPDCLLIGRVITVLGTGRLSGAVSSVPVSTEPILREFVSAHYNLYRREHPESDWRGFFRSEQHGLQHLLLEMRLKATAAAATQQSHTERSS